MKTTLTGTCVAALTAFALTASAQQPAPQPAPQPSTPAPTASASMDKDVKLTGCVKAGADAGSFELANVKKDMGASASAGGATASASAPASAGESKNIKLSPASGVDIAAHVGHTVEVSGTWSGSASAAPPSESAPSGSAKAGKTLSVSAVKMVSATCTTGTN